MNLIFISPPDISIQQKINNDICVHFIIFIVIFF